VLFRLHSLVLSGRSRLSDVLGLGWLHVGPIALGVPIAGALTVWNSLDQLGRPVFGVPFGICWPVLALAIFAVAPLASAAFGLLGDLGAPGGRAIGTRVPGRAGFGASAAAGLSRSGRTMGMLLLAQVLALWLLYDFLYWQQPNHLYDLNVYLGSAMRWLDGGQPYLTAPLAAWPDGPRNDFFLYPPALLPFFAVLARLPETLVAAGWTIAMIGCSYRAFRLLGLSRGWSVLMLAFPPVMIGFESGNVASLTFLLFAASVRAGGALVVDGVFKVQAGVPILWLVRERRFRPLALGASAVAILVLVTLPIVGADSWREWWQGLGYRAASQFEVPALFGYSYAKEIPGLAYAVLCVAFVGLALMFRGRRGLAGLGLASIFASPALWPHGFVFALPAILMLESDTAVLAVLGAGALNQNMWLLFGAGWLAVLAARRQPSGALHPMLGTEGPWPRAARLRSVRFAAPVFRSADSID
jgi:hypothetical protein